jgi:hypothetical protein
MTGIQAGRSRAPGNRSFPVAALAAGILVWSAATGRAQVRVVIEQAEAIVDEGNPRCGVGLPRPAAAAISDPWWDQRATEAADPKPAPLPRDSAAERMAMQRQGVAEAALRRELSVVRAIASDLDPAARRELFTAGEQAVERLAARRALSSIQPLATQEIQSVLEPVLRSIDRDRAAAYRAEIAARAARRRQAALAVLVEAVDQEALLTEPERAALAAGLEERWQSDWENLALAASRARITAARLPPGVADAARRSLSPERFAAWQERLRLGQP